MYNFHISMEYQFWKTVVLVVKKKLVELVLINLPIGELHVTLYELFCLWIDWLEVDRSISNEVIVTRSQCLNYSSFR